MIEVYLYRCDRCSVIIALNEDRGSKFYIDECSACKHWSDHEKISVRVLGVGRNSHYGFTINGEERKDEG